MPSGLVRHPPRQLAFAAAIRAVRDGDVRTQADVAAKAGLSARGAQPVSRATPAISLREAVVALSLSRLAGRLTSWVPVSAARSAVWWPPRLRRCASPPRRVRAGVRLTRFTSMSTRLYRRRVNRTTSVWD